MYCCTSSSKQKRCQSLQHFLPVFWLCPGQQRNLSPCCFDRFRLISLNLLWVLNNHFYCCLINLFFQLKLLVTTCSWPWEYAFGQCFDLEIYWKKNLCKSFNLSLPCHPKKNLVNKRHKDNEKKNISIDVHFHFLNGRLQKNSWISPIWAISKKFDCRL